MLRPSVDLALADTQAPVLANNALQVCTARFDFRQVHVFTDTPQLWPQFHTVSVPTMEGIEDYNRIILERLPAVVEADFCLVAQFDGFILDADAFSPDFYRFDYIGAVWPDYPQHRVGNGGFSWRSRRLLQAVEQLVHRRTPGEAEDLFICRTLRPELEERFGCVFADEDTAQRFSYEIVPFDRPSFGFHGIFNLPLVYRHDLAFLVQNLPPALLAARLPYLRWGAQRLEPGQQQAFAALLDAALPAVPQAT